MQPFDFAWSAPYAPKRGEPRWNGSVPRLQGLDALPLGAGISWMARPAEFPQLPGKYELRRDVWDRAEESQWFRPVSSACSPTVPRRSGGSISINLIRRNPERHGLADVWVR